MPVADAYRCRLCLVTPVDGDPKDLALMLGEALSGGDVASLIVTAHGDPNVLQDLAHAIVPVAQARGVAAIIHNDTRIAGRTGADGVHIDTGIGDLTVAIETMKARKIVGAGGLHSRDDAMIAGEAGADYVLFGRLDGDTEPSIFGRALDLASWWSSMMVVPAIVMGGSSVGSVREAVAAEIEFVALRRAIWEHPRGPRVAVEEVSALLSLMPEPVA